MIGGIGAEIVNARVPLGVFAGLIQVDMRHTCRCAIRPGGVVRTGGWRCAQPSRDSGDPVAFSRSARVTRDSAGGLREARMAPRYH